MSVSSARFSDVFLRNLTLALTVALVGCGVSGSLKSSSLPLAAVDGIVHGGANPVIGAHVTLWETQTGATANAGGPSTYGSPGKALATATTDANGNFSFTAGSYTCASNEYVYLTATGGDTGGNIANPQSLMMAALGSCSHFDNATDEAKIRIWVSEVTTVAAAYALSNFINVTDTGDGLQTVGVGAPPANASASPACTGVGSSMSCVAGGLQHAFANAANLVDAVHFDGTTPTGSALAVAPSNSASVVPQALLNTLGNILQACTNTTGGLATDTNGNVCENLFKDTTPSGGSAPVDTLEAAINFAKYPAQNVSALYNLSGPYSSFFQPSLATSPADFTVAIFYFGTVLNSTRTNFVYPHGVALDIADNVYVETSDAATATYIGVAGISSNGSSIFAGPTQTTHLSPQMMATDTAGNIWLVSDTNTTANTTSAIQSFSETTGASTCVLSPSSGYPWGIAVDRSNNVWYSRASTATYTLGEFPAPVFSGGTCTSTRATFTTTPLDGIAYPYGIAIDQNQNVWGAVNNSSGGYIYVFPNTGTAASPAYGNGLVTNSSTSFSSGYGVAIDSTGNAWFPFSAAVAESIPTLTNGVISAVSLTSVGTGGTTTPEYPEFDGANTLWYPSYASTNLVPNSVWALPAGNTVPTGYRPCYAASGATTCSTAELTYARYVAVDSTGSVWVVAGTNGVVAQIIGTAAPTWPQLSYGHPGVLPQ